MKKGFTLIELLVVVLIIGILSAVALPQYTRAVERSRSVEAIQTASALTRAIDVWLMENGGFPSSSVDGKEMGLAIDLSGGQWVNSQSYRTKSFLESFVCDSTICVIEIMKQPTLDYSFYLTKNNPNEEWVKECYTQLTEIGDFVCKSMVSQGYTYVDNEM